MEAAPVLLSINRIFLMDNIGNFFLSLSIVIPLIVGVIRIKRLGKMYFPIFLVMIIGFLTEIASFVFIDTFRTSNAMVIKIYSLAECCLVLYQLQLWRNSTKDKRLFIFLYVICVLVWIVENIVFLNINAYTPYFRVFYAFVIVLLSINQINSMIFDHEGPLFKNPMFIFCLCFTVLFLYQIVYEASFFIGSDKSVVANKIIIGFGYINFVINLVFAYAIYFIGGKTEEGYNRYFREN